MERSKNMMPFGFCDMVYGGLFLRENSFYTYLGINFCKKHYLKCQPGVNTGVKECECRCQRVLELDITFFYHHHIYLYFPHHEARR
jgi:hypothetical protein